MKEKLKNRFVSLLALALFALCACDSDKDNQQETVPAANMEVDNTSVTLLQGDEITVNVISGNGNYSVKSFDETIATAQVEDKQVTIKATEDSELDENNQAETTILVIDGRKKVARVQVKVGKLWPLTVNVPTVDNPIDEKETLDLFIGETTTVKILTGNGDYNISTSEGADECIEMGELSGQVFTISAKKETGDEPVYITISDKKGQSVIIPVVVKIVDLTLDAYEANFAEPDAAAQYIGIEKGNGGYSFSYQVDGSAPVQEATIVEASETNNTITLKPKSYGTVKVIVTDQKGASKEITVKVNPYAIKLENDATSLELNGFETEKSVTIARGNGGYTLAALTDDNKKYLEEATIDSGKLQVKAKWMGTTTLTLSDAAGQTLKIPVTVNTMAAKLEGDRCFRIDIKNYVKNHAEMDKMQQITFEMVFYPTYSRSLQSFIGLEGVFLLRCEGGKDENLRFEIATKIHKDPTNLSGSTYNDPRFRSQQTMKNDRQKNGQWYHLAIVFDGTQSSTKEAYKMYINGVREELSPASTDYADVKPDPYLVLSEVKGDEALMIGRSGNSEWRLGYCAVAQARMWKTARTADQIKSDMCRFYTPTEAASNENLIGYWVPGNGTASVATFGNYGSAGSELDAVVYNNGSSISKTTFPDRYKAVECPHAY